jgi:hypothetical protein
MRRVYFAHFYCRRENFTHRKKVWYGSCYETMIGGDQLLICWAPMDKDRFANIVAGDELCIKTGRDGENIMTPFQ